MRWRWRAAALLPVSALVAVAGCSVGPSSRPEIVTIEGPGQQQQQPGNAGQIPVPPLEEPRQATVRWGTCPDEVASRLAKPPLPAAVPVECARVNTPLDTPYAPGRGVIRLQLLQAGTGPIPIAVVNDVGDLPGTIYAARLAASLPPDFFTRFSLIGVDRRGTGLSEPADCVPLEIRDTIFGSYPKTTAVADWLEPAKTAGQQCSIELESHLPALDSWRSAADLETVRVALGLPRLNAIGHGEGSRVISLYAERFPDRVGRVVLDGLPDTSEDTVAVLEGVATASEATWQAFAADCVSRNCELGPDAGQVLPTLLDTLRTTPLRIPDSPDLGAGVAVRAVLTGLSDRASWPVLSAAIDKARHGDGASLVALILPVMVGADEQSPTFDAELVIGCNDTGTRLTVAALTTVAADWDKKYPLFGALIAYRLALCGVWPVQTQKLPAPKANGAPPIVVLGTATDPVTPLSGTERATAQLASAALVSWQGTGHGALSLSACATEVAVGFLTDAKVPRDGTVCPP